jgi:hypothetical protein
MRLRSYVTVAAGVGLIALTLTLTPAGNAVAQMKPILAEIINTVANPAIVKDVDHGQQVWHHSEGIFLTGGSGQVNTVFTVPGGKRLVIESVSARVVVTPVDSVSVLNFLTTVQVFGIGFHEIQVLRQGSDLDGNQVFAGTHTVRAYADPGTDVQVQFGRSNIVNNASAVITLVGHLVDVI